MNTIFKLTAWQEKQATLLYYFASTEYLKMMQIALNDAISYSEHILNLAKNQKRDQHLVSSRWGHRDTAENWANNAKPFLKDFQLTTSRQVAERAIEKFNITGNNQFQRGIAENSLNWTSHSEENVLKDKIRDIGILAGNIDHTLDKYFSSNKWNDFNLSLAWERLKPNFKNIPKFRIRPDILVETNRIPLRTGVYMSADDPNATLQFAWHGGQQGKLLLGKTFNYLGMEALAYVGRDCLWLDREKMLDFLLHKKGDPLLKADPFYEMAQTSDLAFELVARNAFTTAASKWLYVELVNDEFDCDAE